MRFFSFFFLFFFLIIRGGVEDTRLEARDTKKIRGQGQPFRGQTTLEAKDRNAQGQGHKRKCSPKIKKKKKGLHKIFQAISKKKKKDFTKIFQVIFTKIRFPKYFSSAPQNFNNSKNTAVLELRTGQDLTFEAKDFKICP